MKERIDISLRYLAANFVSKQLGQLMMHLQGARTVQDIEDIHQARVACRRIRSALQLFSDCFDEKIAKRWEKQMKRLLKSFGAARDLDVQIEFLNSILKQLDAKYKKYRPGIGRMLFRWRQQRDSMQSDVIKTIDAVHKKHVLTDIHIQMEKILFELKPLNPATDSPAVARLGDEQIQRRIRDYLVCQQTLENPEDIAGHHAARIAAKKLRYTMEICDAAMKGKLKPALKKIKKIQTILGEMHDCDRWNEEIDHFIEQERAKTLDFYGHPRPFLRVLPGLLYLQQERCSCRQQLYQQACQFVDQLNEEAFWATFSEILSPQESNPQDKQSEDRPDESKQGTKSDTHSDSV